MARWTRVKRLRGGRSHMESQTCLSKKPRCSSATRRRWNRCRATSPGRGQVGFRRSQGQAPQPPTPTPWPRHRGRALLAASTSFSTRPPLASVSTDSQSLTRKKVLRAFCRSLTMMCCRNQAGLSPAEGRGRVVRAGWAAGGWGRQQRGPQTFVVMPHADLPHAAQAVWGGNLENVQAVAVEGSVPIQVPVAAAAVRPVQHDAHMSCGP